MLFLRKKQKPKRPTPLWLSLLTLALLVYAVVRGDMPGVDAANVEEVKPLVEGEAMKPPIKLEMTKPTGKSEFRVSAESGGEKKVALPNMGELKRTLFPGSKTQVAVQPLAQGKGEPAVCGQTVTITAKPLRAQGEEITRSFTMGKGELPYDVEQSVVGMNVGAERAFTALASAYGTLLNRDDGDEVSLLVTLKAAAPPLPELKETAYRIVIIEQGEGAVVRCGLPARFHVTLFSLDGKKRFSTRDSGAPVEFTPGNATAMFGLEQAVIGMSVGGKRTIIVPPALQRTLNGQPATPEMNAPKNEIVLVDVEAVR